MSKATKRKHVTREVLDEFVTPEDKQIIVKIIGSRGNNLHEAETPNGKNFLISMPSKFRKNVWIKRGDFVIVDPIEEGNKVCAEIAHILYPQQVKYLKKEGLWPEKFSEKAFEHNGDHNSEVNDNTRHDECRGKEDQGLSSESETDDDDGLFVNPNHIQSIVLQSDSDSSDEEINDSSSSLDDGKENSDEECPEISHNVAIKTVIDNNNLN